MRNRIVVSLCLLFGVVGCSGGGGGKKIKLVPVSGIVTMNGAALAGAQVRFFPENGPMAFGETDLNGAYKLKSGSLAGCAVGIAKVAVTIAEEAGTAGPAVFNPNAKTEKEQQENSKKMFEAQLAQQQKANTTKSLIPARYKDVSTSTLEFTIPAAGEKELKIELKD